MDRMLESDEAARRLGVKLPTLYAYVSRGLLRSYRGADPRRSLFALSEVEEVARRSRGGRRAETRLATVTTSVTQLRDDGPAYRGRPAIALAGSASYEEVADLLWGSHPSAPTDWGDTGGPPPSRLRAADRLAWATVMAGAADPLRSDGRPEAVTRAARRVISAMVRSLQGSRRPRVTDEGSGPTGRAGGSPDHPAPDSIARRLAEALGRPGAADCARALNTALVLLADHELAPSTLAVRVVASTRADLYCAVLAGLGTTAGPLHGGASRRVHHLLEEATRHGAQRACDDELRWSAMLPGFGHTVYGGEDPRLAPLLGHFERLADDSQRQVVAGVLALARASGLPPPTVDVGLAALAWASGMDTDAGPTIFTIARVAGWAAHYLEEITESPLRFRARAVYAAGDRRPPLAGGVAPTGA